MQSLLLARAGPSLRRSVPYHARYLTNRSLSSDPGSTTGSSNAPSSGKPDAEVPPSPTSLSLDFSPVSEQDEEATRRTGARSSKDSLSSIERRRKAMGRATFAALGIGLLAGTVYLGREWTEDELKDKKMVVMPEITSGLKSNTAF